MHALVVFLIPIVHRLKMYAVKSKRNWEPNIIGAPIEFGRIADYSGLTGGYGHVFLTNMGTIDQYWDFCLLGTGI